MSKSIPKIENYRNRVIGSAVVPVDELIANPDNFRIHPEPQQQALAGAIDEIGFARSILVNKTTGNVIDGHARITLAMRSGVKELPVEYVELTEDEERKALLFIDPIAAMAATDGQKLKEILDLVQSDDERVQEMIADLAKKEGVMLGDDQPADVEPQVDKAEELRVKWGVESGQLWQLGEHRLICGDCTDKAVVERVMGGEKAMAIVTDPPYGIDYCDVKGTFQKIENDNINPTELIAKSLSIIESKTYYLCCNWKSLAYMLDVLQQINQPAKAVIVWDKLSRIQNLDKFAKRHELIVYSGKYGGEKTIDDDVWQIKRETRGDHPTAKPVDLFERIIKHEDGDIYDPFSGSGTTIIACERLKRKCRAIEISPGYVAVAIQRWVDVSGGTPELIYNGESTNG